MTNEGQGRNGFSRADLLWGLYTTQVDEKARDELAVSLGFEFEEAKVHEGEQERFEKTGTNTSGKSDHDLFGEEPQEEQPLKEESQSKNAAYYRVSNRQINEQQSGSDSSDLDQLPDWFTQASPTILDETNTRIPSCHRVIPLHTELTRWSRLEPFLKKILGANVPGMQVDEQQLVKQVANGKPLDRIPRKQRRSWSTKVRVLVDINEDNFPYRGDFLHLRDQLVQARGTEGLELQYIHDEPGSYVVRYEQYREFIEPWSAPENTTPLLILSDLGMHSNSRSVLYDWLVFGQLLNAQGVRPMVLIPVTERDIDKRLLRYFDCYIWDGSSDLKRVKGGYQAEKDKHDHSESVDDLLSYFFAILRVDAGLLRATRYLFNAFDIGHEAAIWQHRDTVHEGDEWGWQANSRENHQEKALKLFQQLDVKKRAKLVELIGRYHAMLPDELYFEAMHNLMLLEGLDNTGKLSGMVPEVVSQATERYMQDLVKTYAEHPDHGLLDSWVKRHLLRNQAKELRGQYDFWLAFMAFSHLHEERRTGAAESEYPDYLTEDEIAEISRYINHAKTFREYELWQQGEKLVLKSKDAEVTKKTEPEDDWGNHAQAGALLLNMTLDDERIFHVNTDRHGNQKVVSLNLSKIKDGFGFSSAGEHQFQIGRELITVDVSTAQQRKEPWMRSVVSVDGNGFSVESESREGSFYRWYWHPPSYITRKDWSKTVWLESAVSKLISQKINSTRGIWFFSPRYSGWTPDWATECYYDEYGAVAEAEIAGIPQRFRWIEPTTFQMGSPEIEEGRSSDETQHQVTLSQGYWLADTTCTQQLWQAVMGDNPSNFKGENNPVEQVSWDDIQKFLQEINKEQPELNLRLPTEAEWENACRAGTETPFHFGEKDDLNLDKVNYSGIWVKSGWDENALESHVSDVKVFVSYSWAVEQQTGVVGEIQSLCPARGIEFVRDKSAMQHGDVIMDFMNDLTSGDHIITVFSKPYFKSPWCMYELLQIMYKGGGKERTHPVIADDCNLQDLAYRVEVVKYWTAEHEKIKGLLDGVDPALIGEEYKEANRIRDIAQNVSDLMSFANGWLTTPLADLRAKDFAQILDQIRAPVRTVAETTGSYRQKRQNVPQPVKRYPPNQWGLHEMHGNVFEWCEDWRGENLGESVVDPLGPESGKDRVLRGGAWLNDGSDCRSAYRPGSDPSDRLDGYGFRLARSHGQPPVRSVRAGQHQIGSHATGKTK